MHRNITRALVRCALIVPLFAGPSLARAQAAARADSLVSRALSENPRLRMAIARASAARSRIGPAGAWSDPMLMAGLQNIPLSDEADAGHGAPSGADPMSMRMVGVTQMIPYPGKTSLRRSVAREEAEMQDARAEMIRREIRLEVRHAYVDMLAARMLLHIVERQRAVAGGVVPAAEARYVSGTAPQADVLKARTDAALLLEERNALVEAELAAVARLNAVMGDPGGAPPPTDSLPTNLFAARSLPTLDSVRASAVQANPRVRERRALISALVAQAELAKRDHLPDLEVSVQYGQRTGRPDMITATVGVPLPVQRGRKQSATARAAQLDVAAAEAELRAEENAIGSEVARAYAAVERQRANLDLLERAIVPQARATFASASASYQSGRGELLGVLDAMRALFAAETMRVRTLAELAKSLAELQALAGEEVVR